MNREWNPKILMNKCRAIILQTHAKSRMERLSELLLNVMRENNTKDNIEELDVTKDDDEDDDKEKEKKKKCEFRLKRLVEESHSIYEEGYYDTAALRYEAGARSAKLIIKRRLSKCQSTSTTTTSGTSSTFSSIATLRRLGK
tara:strand:- start:34 stop:459 length:426 start_codon:yes stop_codon:yes gene_type:complete